MTLRNKWKCSYVNRYKSKGVIIRDDLRENTFNAQLLLTLREVVTNYSVIYHVLIYILHCNQNLIHGILAC